MFKAIHTYHCASRCLEYILSGHIPEWATIVLPLGPFRTAKQSVLHGQTARMSVPFGPFGRPKPAERADGMRKQPEKQCQTGFMPL